MIRLFNLFGRSRELQRFDQALRTAGLHPHLASEAVKLAALKLLREAGAGAAASDEAAVAELLAYCILGGRAFAETNGDGRTEAVEARIVAALDAGDSLDARLILLAIHAGAIASEVIDRYGLEAG